jgi:hypothetical protein
MALQNYIKALGTQGVDVPAWTDTPFYQQQKALGKVEKAVRKESLAP